MVYGTFDGSRSFDLNDWTTGTGGNWENWSVENGVLTTSGSNAPDCSLGLSEDRAQVLFYPNPASEVIHPNEDDNQKNLMNAQGQIIASTNGKSLRTAHLPNGWYVL